MFVGNSLASLYTDIRQALLNAEEYSPRGKKTKEILSAQLMLKNPRARIAYNSDRKWSLVYAIVETIAVITGKNSVRLLRPFNFRIEIFSDNGVDFYGAYGPRLRPHIMQLIQKLRNDNDTRQAVITIYNSNDLYPNTKDVPCTLSLQFLIRDGKLHLITTMRSNDFFWGLPYDVFVFTHIQELVANELGLELGAYFHQAGSLHVYEQHYEMLTKIHTMTNIEMPPNKMKLEDYDKLGMFLDALTMSNSQKVCLEMYELLKGKTNGFAEVIMNHFTKSESLPQYKLQMVKSYE